MTLTTSSSFAACIESGTDWRDTSKKVLEKLEKTRTQEAQFNIGFLYVSDHLADDLTSILNLFQSVLGIQNWVGSVGIGVCGNGDQYLDEPAISAMIGSVPDNSFRIFPPLGTEHELARSAIKEGTQRFDPMLVLVHGSPQSSKDPALLAKKLDQLTGGFVIGGLCSSRSMNYQIADKIYDDGMSGIMFSDRQIVATTLSQGCDSAGRSYTITRSGEHSIAKLDDETAAEVFARDMRALISDKIGREAQAVKTDMAGPGAGRLENVVPGDVEERFSGEMHVAFPISQSDQSDFLVRNIIGLNEENGTLDVAHNVQNGERVMFVYRDDETVKRDLSRSLLKLRARVEKDYGEFRPKGALYISCLARAFAEPEEGAEANPLPSGEMALIKEIIGDVPLTGFYAAGEIKNGRIYGYSGILTLFL